MADDDDGGVARLFISAGHLAALTDFVHAFVLAAVAVPFVLAIGLAFGKAVGAPEGFGMLTGANGALPTDLYKDNALAASQEA